MTVRPLEVGDAGPGQLLVRTRLSGISSGTELLAYLGKLDRDLPLDERLPGGRDATFAYPFTFGYSAVGAVISGEGAHGSRVFAFRPHVDAFLAEPAELLAVDGLEGAEATLLPLVETALQVTLDADLEIGGRVVVVGLGVLGLITSMLAARHGCDVRGIEPRRDRRAVAESLGVRALDPADAPAALASWTSGEGVPTAIEASGAPEALASTLPLLAHEGTVIVASWYGTQRVSLPLGGSFHRRRLALRSSQVSTIPRRLQGTWTIERRRKEAIDLCHVLPLGAIPTLVVPVDRAADAFEILAKPREGGPMHVVLDHT